MDPGTVIVVLALHLLFSGGLMFLIGQRMPGGGGLRAFAAGAVAFGFAYVGRLALGLSSAHPAGVLLDTLMVLALSLFIVGLRGFVGRGASDVRLLMAGVIAFGVVQAVVFAAGGLHARHVVLNAALGLLYAALAWQAVATIRPTGKAAAAAPAPRQHTASAAAADKAGATALAAPTPAEEHSGERAPRLLLGAMLALLALATLGRAAHIGATGVGSLYQGPVPQAYFGYSSLAALLMCPLLLWLVFVRLNRQLAELASRDALTRVLNRNGLADALRGHFARRGAGPLVWLAVDLDHFKRVNDTHGHAAGDAVLRAVATTLMRHVRAGDFVARLGGEEFLVGCVDVDGGVSGVASGAAGVAQALAERLRREVEVLQVHHARGAAEVVSLSCTVSIGVSAPFERVSDWEEAVRQADTALYRAKGGGRNRVEVTWPG